MNKFKDYCKTADGAGSRRQGFGNFANTISGFLTMTAVDKKFEDYNQPLTGLGAAVRILNYLQVKDGFK